jgi:hypothetical protein
MHKITLLLAALTLSVVSSAFAQAPAPSPETKAAMAKLAFLVGKWSGDATFQMGPQASELTQAETVESRLDGLVLVIEGIGTGKADGKVHHHAFATISYDPAAKNYRVVAVRADGNAVITTGAFLEDGAFQWGFEMGNMAVRYTIRHTEGDEWHETGEVTLDKATWRKMIDMRLKRV